MGRLMFTGVARVLVVLLAGASTTASAAKVPPKFEGWLGRQKIEILQTATRVEAFVVGPVPVGARGYLDDNTGVRLPPGTPATIQHYPVRRSAVVLGRPFAQELARLILDERSYEPTGWPFGRKILKGCVLSPIVALRVAAKRGSVDVLLCFNCDQIGVANVRGTPHLTSGDIDPARPAFLRLLKSVLGPA